MSKEDVKAFAILAGALVLICAGLGLITGMAINAWRIVTHSILFPVEALEFARYGVMVGVALAAVLVVVIARDIVSWNAEGHDRMKAIIDRAKRGAE